MTRLATALKRLPPRPDCSLVLGEDRYGEEELFADILLYGRAVGPREEAAPEGTMVGEEAAAEGTMGREEAAAEGTMGREKAAAERTMGRDEAAAEGTMGREKAAAEGTMGRWELAWRAAPLLIHDAGLVNAIGAIDSKLMDFSAIVSAAAIGEVLEEHPGPVGCLRLESPSGCPSPAVVAGWMDRLRAKKGEECLWELVVVNMSRPKNEAYSPLRRLPTGLRRLSLCFFEISPLEGDHLTGLKEVRLTGCYFCGQELSAVIAELYGLTTMVLSNCRLTSGCGPEGLTIVSNNLTQFEMRACTATNGISLQYTPRLHSLCTGVRPQDRDARILIDIRTPGALQELHGMRMNCHELSYITQINAKFKGIRVAPLPNLRILKVCMEMTSPQQIFELLDLIVHLPRLTELTIMRLDNASEDEKFMAGEDAFRAICLANTLKELTMDHFKGGPAELMFAINILATASELTSVCLKPHGSLSRKQSADVCAVLINSPHASACCKISLFG